MNVIRTAGTQTQRGNASVDWERPAVGQIGDLWNIVFHLDTVAYNAIRMNLEPNFSPLDQVDTGRALPTAAVSVRLPMLRAGGTLGSQVIEPILQVAASPNVGSSQNIRYPDEDSLAFEYSDTNLFALNRFAGIDRLEGGVRAAVGLHGSWMVGNISLDGLIGQSYRTENTNIFPVGSGLNGTVSDVVGRMTVHPADWLDLTYRTRLDKNNLAVRMADALAAVGDQKFRVTAGYLYTNTDPFTQYDQALPLPAAYFTPRNEITLGASTQYGQWRLSGYARRDLETNTMVVSRRGRRL